MFDQLLRPSGAPPQASRVVGLDLGERRTRVVVAEGSASGMRVVSWSDEPTPPGLLSGGRAVRSAELVAWLRRALGSAGAGAHVWIACPWADVQVKRLQVPDPANRAATLRGLSVNSAFRTGGGGDTPAAWCHDYCVADAGSGAVMAVAARNDAVRSAAAAVAAAGAQVRGVSVAESAAVHAWLATAGDEDARAVLLEAGHNGVTLVVMDAGAPVGFRRVLYGGGKVLSERGGWTPPAEIPPPLVEEWCARIGQEVRMLAGAVFRGGAEGIPPVSFMGGLGEAGGLVAGLGGVLGVKVERWRGAGGGAAAGGAGGEMGSGMAVAYGLARQGLAEAGGGGGPVIQLLRAEDVRETGRPDAKSVAGFGRSARIAAAACVAAATAGGGAEAWLRLSLERARDEVAAAQADSARAEVDIARVGRLERERARLGGETSTIERLRGGRQSVARLMATLAEAMPENAWADSLLIETGGGPGAPAFRISGYAGTAGQVAALEQAIVGGPVKEVTVLSLAPAEIAGLAVVRWTLVGTLDGEEPEERAEPGEAPGTGGPA
jgi:hypothetical protein